MAKVSTTLRNIEKNQEEEKERKLKEEKEKQLKKEYNEILKNSINDVVSFSFENALEDGESLEKVFNDLILNDYKYKQEIEKMILSEKITVEDWKTSPDCWEEIEISKPKFENIYKFDDIEKNYVLIVKKLYNNYILKEKTRNKDLEKKLVYNFNNLILDFNINDVVKLLQLEEYKKDYCKELSGSYADYNYLYTNYNNILRKWYSQNKPIIREKEVKTPRTQTTRTQPQKKESSGLIGGLIGWWLGGKL